MIKFFVILFLLFCFIFIIYFLYYERKLNSKSIYNLAINDEIPQKIKKLKKIIGNRLQDDLLIMVIQDDIVFLDSKYYWPKRTVYIHLSDMNNFIENYNYSNIYIYSIEEIDDFLKSKVLIH